MLDRTKQYAKTIQEQYGLDSKGYIGDLSGYAIAFVVAAVMITIGATIVDELGGQVEGSAAESVTEQAQEGFETFGDFLPIIAIVAAAAVIMALLVNRFMAQKR